MRTRILLITAAVMTMSGLMMAQKPKSKKEVDAVLAVQNATTADARIAAVDNLISNFADTEFKSWALTQAAHAEQAKGDSAKAEVYAEQAIKADPKSYEAMLLLAGDVASHTREFDLDKDDKLARATKLADEGIKLAAVAPKPNPQIPDAQWEGVKKDNIADGHKALGLVALVQKKYDVAVDEFHKAVYDAASPDPSDRVRLASALIDAGKPDDAEAELAKVQADPKAADAVKKFATSEQARAEKVKAAKK